MTKTINQINGFCQCNSTLAFYCRQNEIYYANRLDKLNYRHRSFDFKCSNRTYNLTILGTFLYKQAQTYLARFIGEEKPLGYVKSDSYDIRIGNRRYVWSLNLDLTFKGVILFYSSWESTKICHQGRVLVRSNQSMKDINLADYFEKHILSKELYPYGLFQEIQLTKQLTKTEARQQHREWWDEIINGIKNPTRVYDAEKPLARHLRRHHNLDVRDGNLSLDEMLMVRRKYPHQPKRRAVQRFRPVTLDNITLHTDGDIDEIVSYFWEEMDELNPKDTVII